MGPKILTEWRCSNWRGWCARPFSSPPTPWWDCGGQGRPSGRAGAGQQEDGGAKTRLAYLGCVCTRHQRDEKGHPIRDPESTTYLSSFGSIDAFGPALRQEAIHRGLGCAKPVVLLIDGTTGLANRGRLCFSTATQTGDFYQALEHAGEGLEALPGSKDPADYPARLHGWAKPLRKAQVEKLIAPARQECPGKAHAPAVEQALGYFANNVDRMPSGMFGGEPGAENILAFRCIHASRRLPEFGKDRLNSQAARNNLLPLAA